MPITIKLFASLRESAGWAERQLGTAGPTVGDVRAWLATQVTLPTNTLAALNHSYVKDHCLVKDGDEVAFFPPVTGG
jgi:sulfur-carrier protein